MVRRGFGLILMGVLAACGGTEVTEQEDPGLVSLEGTLANAYVLAGEDTEMVARIRIGTSAEASGARPPINTALVIDTSGSMEGAAIEHAKEASLAFLGALGEGDRLSVVVFHSTTEVLLPSTPIEDSNLADLRARIEGMEATGTTDMAGGLQAGLQELMANLEYDGINRMVLLGDGVPNSEANITALAQAAGERNITITALGLGRDYNEVLMGDIAQLSGGHFEYIENSDRVLAVFQEEVLRMRQVFGRSAVVTLSPGPGVRIESVVGQNVSENNGSVQIALGDLTQGEFRDLFVRTRVTGHREDARVELLDAHLSFQDAVVNAGALERRVFLGLRATADAEEVARNRNADVERAAEQVQAAAVTVQAVRMAREGDLERARAVLQAAEDRARGYATTAQSTEVLEQAERMEQLRGSLEAVAPPSSMSDDDGDYETEDAPSQEPMPAPMRDSTVREIHNEAMDALGW
ncbi:MAG: VWA domain-containing protein [Myxococcota bacterium]